MCPRRCHGKMPLIGLMKDVKQGSEFLSDPPCLHERSWLTRKGSALILKSGTSGRDWDASIRHSGSASPENTSHFAAQLNTEEDMHLLPPLQQARTLFPNQLPSHLPLARIFPLLPLTQ